MATTQPLPADIPVQESEQPAAMVANESALISSSLVLEEEGSLGLDPKFAPLPIELDVAIPLREFRVAMPGDRTEQATPHRREKARKEGDVLHSRELQAAAGTLAGVMALKLLASRATENWRSALAGFLNLGRASNWEPQGLQPTLATLRALSLSVLAPIGAVLVAIVLAALFAGVAQRGSFALNVAAVGFRLDRINPFTNVKNLFSLRAASRLGKSLIPVSLLSVFAVQRIAREMHLPPFSTARLEVLGSDIYGLLLTAAWMLFAWAGIDYLVEWRSRESRLMMSREDLREEFKETSYPRPWCRSPIHLRLGRRRWFSRPAFRLKTSL